MLVHMDSTAVHIFDIRVEDKTETKLLKSNGVFLNLLKNYVDSKENSDWLETTAFSSDVSSPMSRES